MLFSWTNCSPRLVCARDRASASFAHDAFSYSPFWPQLNALTHRSWSAGLSFGLFATLLYTTSHTVSIVGELMLDMLEMTRADQFQTHAPCLLGSTHGKLLKRLEGFPCPYPSPVSSSGNPLVVYVKAITAAGRTTFEEM